MFITNIRKAAAISALGLVALLGTSVEANAQYGRGNQNQKKVTKQQEKAAKAQAKANEERIKAEQLRQAQMNNRRPYPGPGNNGHTYNNNARYRVVRNGRNYNMDHRAAELLKQAVNAGYQQGYQAGRSDSNSRRRSSWNGNTMYKQGTYGYQSYVDRGLYQHYFQQGFQKGYQDGYSSRNQYGSNNGGNILSSILGQILNIQTY